MRQTIYFSGLNGLRAIASLAVVFSHTTLGLDSFGLESSIFGRYANGNSKTTLLAGFGVSIFFALSGFLITYLLLEEKKTGEINIRNFYIRRILRIWPLYYLYLFISLATLFIFDLHFNKLSVFFYFFLSANVPFILSQTLPFLAHYWSLGVEEQFYSFWPWVIKKSKSVLTSMLLICLGLLLLKFIFRFIDIKTNNGEPGWIYQIIHITRFHCMLIGAIAAYFYFNKNELFLKLTNTIVAQAVAWFSILLITINKFHIASFIDNELVSVITVLLIIGQIEQSKRIINLEKFIFNFIGKISYGVYVIHPLVIFYLSKVMTFSDKESIVNYIMVYSAVFAITIALAYVSYHYFEKRFLLLKDKYSTVKSIS